MLTHVALVMILAASGAGKTTVREQPGRMVALPPSVRLAAFPFATPGCYPSGSVLGMAGETPTFTRAGTQACAGVGTCQANELCVTSGGAVLSASTAMSWPVSWSGPGSQQGVFPLHWCVCVTAEPTGLSWSAGSGMTLWSIGANGGASTTQLLAQNNGALSFRVYDYNAVARTGVSWTHGYADGSRHSIAGCYYEGTLTLYSDGSPVGTTSTGGNGIIAIWPTPLYFGARSTGLQWVGALKDFKIIKSADHARCGAGY